MKKLLEEKKWPLIKLIEIVGYIKGKKPFNMVDEEKENYCRYLLNSICCERKYYLHTGYLLV